MLISLTRSCWGQIALSAAGDTSMFSAGALEIPVAIAMATASQQHFGGYVALGA